MSTPIAELTSLRTSTTALLQWLESLAWSDADVRAPSGLPGWTRGHVLTHIARNADSITRTLAGALRDENTQRYPDGPAGRNADIDAGAGRPMTEQLADVRSSADRLDRVFAALADAEPEVWDRIADDRPARAYTTGRWREVEIHRVDLAADYTPQQWPAEFVAYLLPELAGGLATRAGDLALRVEVAAEGSTTTDLGGRVWQVGEPASAIDVVAPDWALLAWLTGREWAAVTELPSPPQLPAWL